MRPLESIASGLLGLLGLCSACYVRPPADVQPVEPARPADEPSDLQTLLAALDDPARRAATLVELRRLALEIEAGNDPQARAAAASVLLPGLSNRFPIADLREREAGLVIALALAGPEAVSLWRLALRDGALAEIELALAGLRRAELHELDAELIDRLAAGLVNFDPEASDDAKLVFSLISTLGDLRVTSAVELLIQTLEAPQIPRTLARALVSALGRIGDARAVDALIAVQFRIPDQPSTQSIAERSLRALGAIGEPALPGVLATFAGTNRRVNELAKQHIDEEIVRLTMLRALGVIGSARAVEPILASFPRAGCAREPAAANEDELMQAVSGRAFSANALGYIADAAAVPTLCACNGVSENPIDVYEIASALGRIGGEQAFACLVKLVERGRYHPDWVPTAGMEVQIRWDAFRWAVVAAPPSKVDALLSLLQAATPEVRAEIERLHHDVGIAVLRECGDDSTCYREVLDDVRRQPFERELAAFNLARRATPGDLELAAALTAAFETPEPEVRIHMAWLAAKVAADRACPACARNLEAVMKAEELSKDASMMAPWLSARQTIDKVHVGAR